MTKRRRVLLLAVALIGGLVPILAPSAAPPAQAIAKHSWFADSDTTDEVGTRQEHWMRIIPDHVGIEQLSIPMTHDSMSFFGGPITQTQTLCGENRSSANPCDLTEQLNAGIRAFDIRYACEETNSGFSLFIYHGSEYQYATLKSDVLDVVKNWLSTHPSETVIMDISDSGTDHDNDCSPKNELHSVIKEYENDFWFGPEGSGGKAKPPTLLDARGKMIYLNHETWNDDGVAGTADDRPLFPRALQNRNCTTETCSPYWRSIGEVYTGDDGYPPLNDVCEGVGGGGGIESDDGCWSYNGKQDLIEGSLEDAINNSAASWPNDEIFYTDLVGAKSSPIRVAGGYDTGSEYIPGMLQRAYEYMKAYANSVDPNDEETTDQFGVVSMDFPGPSIIDFLIHQSTAWGRQTSDIGVLMDSAGCGPYEPLSIYLDNEDDDNANDSTGWIGGTVSDDNTELKYCRVPSTDFRQLPNNTYAVLALSSYCPGGSDFFSRTSDDEDDNNNNHHAGDILPSFQDRSTRLRFCVFSANPAQTGPAFPNLGIPYGVFGRWLPQALPEGMGYFHMDDEDEDNENSVNNFGTGLSHDFLYAGLNTTYFTNKVRGTATDTALSLPPQIDQGTSYDVTATVSALTGTAVPGGTVRFRDTFGDNYDRVLDDSGVATVTTYAGNAGAFTWTAEYLGTPTFEASGDSANGTIDPEAQPPRVTSASPLDSSFHTAATLRSACGTVVSGATDVFCGNVTDIPIGGGSGSGLDFTEFALKGPNGKWWDGDSFDAASSTYLDRTSSATGFFPPTATFTHDVPDAALVPGAYTLRVRVADSTGNSSVLERLFQIDAQTPTVRISGPLTRSDVGYGVVSYEAQCPNAPGICGTARDDTKIDHVSVLIEQLGFDNVRRYWNGTSFETAKVPVNASIVSRTPGATGGEGVFWHVALPTAAMTSAGYDVIARAFDAVGKESTTFDQEQFFVTTHFPTGALTTTGLNGRTKWNQCEGFRVGDPAPTLIQGGVCGTSSKSDVRVAVSNPAGNWWSAEANAFVPSPEPLQNRTQDFFLPIPPEKMANGAYTVRAIVVGDGGNNTPVNGTFTWEGTGPSVTLTLGSETGADGWWTTPPTAAVNASDPNGHNCPTSATYSGADSATGSISVTCSDNLGNPTTASIAVKVDRVGPTTAVSVTGGTAGKDGWLRTPPNIVTTGTDAVSGLAFCDATKAWAGGDGAALTATGTCFDNAGNDTLGTSAPFKLDRVAPITTGSIPAPNGLNGWYTGTPTLTANGTDALSGIDFCEQRRYTGPEGTNIALDAMCSDVAGNTDGDPKTIKVDRTAPAAAPKFSRAPNPAGWVRAPVIITWNWTDKTSGLSSCPVSVRYEGPDTATPNVSSACADLAGLSNTSTAAFKYDATKPKVVFKGQKKLFTILEAVDITCTASDVTSGIATTTCAPVKGNAYDFDPGLHSRTATARDRADNTKSTTVKFTVDATYAELCTLTRRFADPAISTTAMCQELTNALAAERAGNTTAKSNALAKYEQLLREQAARGYFTGSEVTVLTKWSRWFLRSTCTRCTT